MKKRSSRSDVFCEKGVLRNFAEFTGKHLCHSLFFNKVAGGACNFIKKETLAQMFSCEFCEISKNTFFTEHLRWLLLEKCLFCNVTEKSYFSRFFLVFFLPQFSGRKKQPFTDVLHNTCCQKFCNIPVLESLFNTVANFLACSFKCPSTEFFLVLIFSHSDHK